MARLVPEISALSEQRPQPADGLVDGGQPDVPARAVEIQFDGLGSPVSGQAEKNGPHLVTTVRLGSGHPGQADAPGGLATVAAPSASATAVGAATGPTSSSRSRGTPASVILVSTV